MDKLIKIRESLKSEYEDKKKKFNDELNELQDVGNNLYYLYSILKQGYIYNTDICDINKELRDNSEMLGIYCNSNTYTVKIKKVGDVVVNIRQRDDKIFAIKDREYLIKLIKEDYVSNNDYYFLLYKDVYLLMELSATDGTIISGPFYPDKKYLLEVSKAKIYEVPLSKKISCRRTLFDLKTKDGCIYSTNSEYLEIDVSTDKIFESF